MEKYWTTQTKARPKGNEDEHQSALNSVYNGVNSACDNRTPHSARGLSAADPTVHIFFSGERNCNNGKTAS